MTDQQLIRLVLILVCCSFGMDILSRIVITVKMIMEAKSIGKTIRNKVTRNRNQKAIAKNL